MYRLLSILISLFFIFPIEAYEVQLSIGTIFRNEAPYLDEWIHYHKMIGVKHFWLYNDGSTDNFDEVLRPYIEEGVVELIDWPKEIYGGGSKVTAQVNAMKDVTRRSAGVSKWLALIDIDEFILPMRDSTITECLENHFSDASGIYVNWRHFGTGGVYLSDNDSILPSLIAASEKHHPSNGIGKSIIRPDHADPDQFWNPHHFMMQPKSKYYNANQKRIFFTGIDLHLDGRHYDRLIRINHYKMRDENFYRNRRLPNSGSETHVVERQYRDFNRQQDTAILEFIMKNYPEHFESFWSK